MLAACSLFVFVFLMSLPPLVNVKGKGLRVVRLVEFGDLPLIVDDTAIGSRTGGAETNRVARDVLCLRCTDRDFVGIDPIVITVVARVDVVGNAKTRV